MLDQILNTKLFAPPCPGKVVPRPALLARLSEGLAGKLTVVSAPAGFGKSSLLAEWLTTGDRLLTAWFSLDADDNDPIRFWSHLTAAIERATGLTFEPIHDLLGQAASPRAMALACLTALSGLPGPLLVVLDDVHVLNAPALLESVGLLVDRLPTGVHLVLLTRTDPPLPLARMRARGELTEIRADDLRFTDSDAALYLNQRMGLDLGAGDVQKLRASTEGWIAGLQLAALSMRTMTDRQGFIAGFNGRNRYIMDYLTEEALAQQPPEIQEFLLETSILDRFDGAICRAVTSGGHGQEMLERLDQLNLFLVPQDDVRCWYRYHHLFAEMLRHLLHMRRPGMIEALHRKAARAFDAQGFVFEAIHHALKGQDFEWAADRIDTGYTSLKRGQLAVLIGWLAALPEALLTQRPHLNLLRARVLLTTGQTDRLLSILDTVREGLSRQPDPTLDVQSMALEGYLARAQGDLPRAIRLSRQALDLLAPEDAGWRLLAGMTLALGHHFSCEPEAAARAYEELARQARRFGEAYYVIVGLSLHGALAVFMGRFREAQRLFDEAFGYAAAQGVRDGTAISFGIASQGELLRERNEFEAAERFLLEGTTYGQEMLDSALNSYTGLSRLRHSQGDLPGAVQVLEECLALVREADMPLLIARCELNLAMQRALLALSQGSAGIAEAVRWAKGVTPREAPGYLTWTFQAEGLAAAKVHLVAGNDAEAETWLASSERIGRKLDQRMVLVRVHILRTLLHERRGERSLAQAALAEAIALAEPEAYVRAFLDEGPAIGSLLREVAKGLSGHLQAFAERLLMGVATKPAPTSGLAEALSEREQEVLTLIAAGHSNKEIGALLGIELNTVKKHSSSILGKLACSNRTQAVARARDLQLL
ncbi:MAG TPA: LuxR C-terminal-related transcriptional regulator [Stenomitos sp.]